MTERAGAARPRVLLIAPQSSYRTAAYCEAARRLGARMVVASSARYPLIPETAEGLRVDLDSPGRAIERILEVAGERAFDAVVATDDATVELGSRIAKSLGLAHNPPEAARTARRKDLSRAALERTRAPLPRYRRLDLQGDLHAQAAEIPYPCVVKPLALAGSRGIMRADGPRELVAACKRITGILSGIPDPEERRFVLVEDFLPGVEVAVEGMLSAGELQVLAVFDKPDPLDGPFFEETYYITPSRLADATQAALRHRVQEACAAYGLREGPVHAELRVAGGDACIIELAARTIGGDCARLLEFGTGRTLEELVLSQALGEPLALSPEKGAAGVLMLPVRQAGTLRRVEGVLSARAVPGVDDVAVTIREGYELVPLPEGSQYLGFVFAHGPEPEAVEAALREAHARLKVVVAPAWRLEPAEAAG